MSNNDNLLEEDSNNSMTEDVDSINSVLVEEDDNNSHICTKCYKPIVSNLIMCQGKTYHRTCFTCSHCKNLLDPATVNDSDSQLLCKAWYNR